MLPSDDAAPGAGLPSRAILGIDVTASRGDAVIEHLRKRLHAGAKTLVCYANSNLLVAATSRPALQATLRRFIVLNDGLGMDIASRVLHGTAFPENLNGTDFTPRLLKALGPRAPVFIFGAKPGVAEQAAAVLHEQHGISICGTSDGYGWSADPEGLLRRIQEADPAVLVVALGNPQQELWIAEHAHAVPAKIIVGVGALLDFVSGRVPRAPALIRALRLEWVFRLMLEPRRLWKRYSVDLVVFLWHVGRERRRSMQA